MFSRTEIRQNLLGCLEIALFMPQARTRFSDDSDHALKSFVIPILLFPLSIIAIQLVPKSAIDVNSANVLSLLLSLRLVMSWAIFFGVVYWIAKQCERTRHFSQFVTASNWLTIPATLVYLPVAWALLSGSHSWDELYPFMLCVTGYTYLFSAYMAANILKMPFELGGFIVIINVMINDSMYEITHWVGNIL